MMAKTETKNKLAAAKLSLPHTELDARKRLILKAVIDDFVETCEPVGSKSLLQRHQLGISSATVRNEMAELENLGYLEQPHTSAGRIPSDKGYRAYVDFLLTQQEIPAAEKERIDSYIDESIQELSSLIRSAAAALAEQTNCTSLVLTPTYGKSQLQQIKILMIEPGKALVVVVLSAGVVRDRLVRIPEVVNQRQLQDLALAIEAGLSGQKLDDITLIAVTAAAHTGDIPEAALNQVLFEAYVSIKQAENVDVYMQGSHKLLTQPEFADVNKAHRFLNAMSSQGLVAGYMAELGEDLEQQGSSPRPAYLVRIGQEITLEGLSDCSFITSSYRLGEHIKGRIGVIGPKRMQYSKIIADISFVNQRLSAVMRSLTAGDREEIQRNEMEKG